MHNGDQIYILWVYRFSPNRFEIDFVAFPDPENIGFITLFAIFGNVFTELYSKNEFYVMAELIMQIAQGCQSGIKRIINMDPSKISKLQKNVV